MMQIKSPGNARSNASLSSISKAHRHDVVVKAMTFLEVLDTVNTPKIPNPFIRNTKVVWKFFFIYL